MKQLTKKEQTLIMGEKDTPNKNNPKPIKVTLTNLDTVINLIR